jgi:hypothetical protein
MRDRVDDFDPRGLPAPALYSPRIVASLQTDYPRAHEYAAAFIGPWAALPYPHLIPENALI